VARSLPRSPKNINSKSGRYEVEPWLEPTLERGNLHGGFPGGPEQCIDQVVARVSQDPAAGHLRVEPP
jgi:hypothetical protein